MNLNVIVEEVIREYMDKMTANAMRSLGTWDNPTQLAKDTYRYVRSHDLDAKNNKAIVKNEWLIHITTRDVGEKIMREGFKSSIKDLNFRATQDIDRAREMTSKGLCFACSLEEDKFWGQIVSEMNDYGEDWCGIIFKASGFKAFTSFGDFREVVFSAQTAHDMCMLLPMTEQECEQYLGHNEVSDFNGVKVISGNGKVLFKGDMEEFFHNRINLVNGKYVENQRAKNWLNNNYAQYRNNFARKK